MKRTLLVALVALMLLMIGTSASAMSPAYKYALMYEGVQVPMETKIGRMMKHGSALMVPMELICKTAGLSYEVSEKNDIISIEREDGKIVKLQLNNKKIRVDGVVKTLRVKVMRQPTNLQLTADIRVLKELGLDFKNYPASKTTLANGYPAGVLVVAKKGGDLALPSIVPEPEAVLPNELKEAAKLTNQIIGVDFDKGSNARLTLYQKNKDGIWNDQYSVAAYVGKNGIDKQAEGDGKTPTGMFNLTQPFGILKDPGAKIPGYVRVTKYHYWVSTSGSGFYNQLIDTRLPLMRHYKPTAKDEKLIDYKGVYNYGLFIDYNAEGIAGKGSAIFLHCTSTKKDKSTAGCIAVPQNVMVSLLRTIKEGAKIVIY